MYLYLAHNTLVEPAIATGLSGYATPHFARLGPHLSELNTDLGAKVPHLIDEFTGHCLLRVDFKIHNFILFTVSVGLSTEFVT